MEKLEQAARLALNALVKGYMGRNHAGYVAAIDALREALEQPAPEMSYRPGGLEMEASHQEPYDQQALELCEVCGWKTLIPGDCCLNCVRTAQQQERPDFSDMWTGYLKDGETPFERFMRERADMTALIKLYQRAREENERLDEIASDLQHTCDMQALRLGEIDRQEPTCVAIVEVFETNWWMEYLSLPVGKHKLYAQQYTYAAPQQRMPLTDSQIAGIASDIWGSSLIAPQSYMAFARKIEAAIKEQV